MKKFFSFFAALLFAGSMMAAEAILQYTGGVTANMVGDGANNAAALGLDEDLFTVLADKGANQNLPGLNQANDIRLYADRATGNGNTITVSIASGTITSIVLDIKQTATFVVKAGETAVTEENGAYAINAASFSIQNTTTGATTQLRLNKITITYESGDVPPTPTMNYYVAGSMTNWGPLPAYKLAANPANEGEYMGEFTFAANDEFKVGYSDGTTIESTNYFPNGMDNNYVITEAGDYTVYFRPDGQGGEGWHEGYINAVKKVIPQYEVAEAIAAGLTDNTEILVRGVITKIEFKGKNFAKYGSVNIYVADATNAEGEFEFYNCYSLNADTFRTSTPAYDATSSAFAEFEEVADGNGNAIHVGDTVIAFGKYILYDTTHELNTGCYLTEIKHPGDAPVVEHTYTVAGAPAELFVAEWDPTLETNDMQPIVGSEYTHAWQKENVTLAAGKVEFKVVEDHDWANPAYPAYEAGNYELTISEAAIYTISIYFNEETKEISANALKTGEAPVVEEWAEIVFTEAVAAEDLAEDASFTLEGSEFAATITDPDNKMSIDANTARFGTVEAFKDYTLRLKTGGKSSSTKNFITLNIPEDGQLRIAVRTGSNAATDRNLVIVQGVDTLYNQVVKEEDKTVVPGEESSTNYYPYIIVDVNAGSVVLSYPTNGLNFYAFAFKAGEVVPPTPEHTYTVAGGSDVLFGTAWDPANTANDMALVEGLYTWEKSELTLAAGNIGFKVCEDHAWTTAYPAQDYQLNIPEAGIYTITITFNAETKDVAAVATKTGEAVVVPTVAMHGNFLGSWADTENFAIAQDNASASLTLTLAEGNYEFGMRIGGSGNWTANGANLTRETNTTNLAEGSGNMHIAADVAGDYVFTYTYETQVLEVVYPEAPAAIEVTLSSITTPGALIWTDAVAEEGWWQIMGANEACDFSISNLSTTETAGVYTIDDLDANFSYINIYGENDTTKVAFVDGSVTVAVSEEGIATLNGTLVGSDGNNYIFNLTYKDPVAEKTVNVAIPEWELIDYYVASNGLFVVSGMEHTSAYVQLSLWMPQGATEIYGDYTEEDFDLQNFGCYVADANDAYRIFSATINVAKAENGRVLVTADLLCYNNTLYKVTTTIGEGINAVEAAQKAVKMIRNGQVEIIKNGVHYNINGAVIR